MDRRFLGIIAAIIIIFIGVFAITQSSNNKSSGGGSNGAKATHHVDGQGQAGVTLQEWGDYECPVCEVYYQPLKQVVDQYRQQIYFQFSNLPLTQIHPNAFAAARAAEAAGMQNKYWQMHDKLYGNQNDWASSTTPLAIFSTYAQQIGLNVNKFKQDYASSQVNDAINADRATFLNTSYANHDQNKEATPTFFLDGKYISNSQFTDSQTGQPSAAKFGQILQAEIDKKKAAAAKQ